MNRQYPRVLVTEDDSQTRVLLAGLFLSWKWDAEKVGTVAQAIAALEAMPFDLVLLDMQLPDGDGVEVLKHIRNMDAPPYVAVISGKPMESLAKAIALKPDRLVSKPVHLEVLRDIAETLFAEFRPRPLRP